MQTDSSIQRNLNIWNRRLLLASSGMRKITVSIHWLLQQDSFCCLTEQRYLVMCFWNQFRTHFHCNLVLQRIFANYKKFQAFSKTWWHTAHHSGSQGWGRLAKFEASLALSSHSAFDFSGRHCLKKLSK